MAVSLTPVDILEIVTLEDNYVDLVTADNDDVIRRARPLRGTELSNSILAENGFSALVRTLVDGERRTLLFDFGFSADVVARNAEALDLDLGEVEEAALSHGHIDHFGGLDTVARAIGRRDIPLVVHPGAFKRGRHIEPAPGARIVLPDLERARAREAGFRVVEAQEPRPMLGGRVLFLGEIPRRTEFERGLPNAYYEDEAGAPAPDSVEDDTALVMHLAGRGLVVLSGCAHSGIVNTLEHARRVTGIDRVHAVMGGFHLASPAFESAIEPTVLAVKEMAPAYVVPTHCTGRRASLAFERELPGQFILNMAGTTLSFAGC